MEFFKSEIKKTRKQTIYTIGIVSLIYLIIGHFIQDSYVLFRNIDLWMTLGQYLGLLYVLVAIAPVCWVMVYERKNNYLLYVIPRISKKKYILKKWFITSFSGGAITFSISFISLIVILYVFPEVNKLLPMSEDNALTVYYKGYYYVNHPFVYGTLLCLWRGVLGASYATLGFVISLYNKNIFIVMSSPFLFDLFNSFILGTLGYSQFEVMTGFDPSRVNGGVISKYTFIVSELTIILGIFIVFSYHRFYKKNEIFEV